MSAWGAPPGDRRPGNPRAGTPSVASGKSLNNRSELVGRSDELAALALVLDRAREGRSASLLLTGEPGIGKSALLEAARLRAEGFAVLSCRGAEAESDLSHAGLLELLTPVRHLVAQVPEGQAAALSRALGWSSAEPADASGLAVDRFLVAAGTLSLLAAAAADGPVLVLVDDSHWLDRESAFAVTFAARRLNSDAVAFLFNGRPDASSRTLFQGIPAREVGQLTDAEAAELLPPEVAPPVVTRLHSVTGGNPLALLEIAGRLNAAQRAGAAPLPDPLPVGEMLHAVYDEVISGLPDPLRSSLLLAALDATVPLSTSTIDEATKHGILSADAPTLRFRHPLLRSALLRLASPAELRRAHLEIATAMPAGSPGSIRHHAAAAIGTDDDIADALATLAAGDRARSGHAAASIELERAARLTSSPSVAADRLVAAAHEAFVAGDLSRTEELIGVVLGKPTDPATRGRAFFALGMLEQYAGSVVRAAEHLATACVTLNDAELVDALSERALVAFTLNDLATFSDCASKIATVGDLEDPGQRLRARFTGGLAGFLQGDYATADAQLAEVTELALAEELRDDPRALLLMALAAGLTGTVDVALRRGMSRVDEVRDRGGVGMLVPLLALTAAAHAITGDHARAFAAAQEADDLGACLGYVGNRALALEQLAWQNAARGFHEEARAALEESRGLLERAETVSAAAHFALTAAFCALCAGDLDEVASLLEARIEADGGLGSSGEPLGVAPMLIEAYVGLGRADDALALTGRFAETTSPSSPPEVLALLRRSQGLSSTDLDASREHFEESLAAHADDFEKARTELLFGSRLRRQGQRVAARQHLTTAHAAFSSMGLTLWTEAAASELRATGARTRSSSLDTGTALTAQETRVALLVAEGKSNKEVAAALFLSPKTIERHLSSVFRKQGFRSRGELARAYLRRDN